MPTVERGTALTMLALAAPMFAFAADLQGVVTGVRDGDSLWVMPIGSPAIEVRIRYIDAPEIGQPFGQAARTSLRDLCAAKQAVVTDMTKNRDRYGRVVGRVSCAGVDAGAAQLQRGMAWVFDRYTRKGSALYATQAGARNRRLGLWAAEDMAVPPWEWRAAKRRGELL